MTEKVLDQMAKDTAPKNFSEFELGLVLAALINEMDQDENEFDPEIYDNMINKAPQVLEYWRRKYADEIAIVGSTVGESIGDGE